MKLYIDIIFLNALKLNNNITSLIQLLAFKNAFLRLNKPFNILVLVKILSVLKSLLLISFFNYSLHP